MTELEDEKGEAESSEPQGRQRSLSRDGDSLYVLLNIPKDASPEEIKKAYRKMALKHHPDKNPNDPTATERFKEINRAHTVLSNPTKRRLYDKYGSMGLQTADQVGDEMAEMLLKFDTIWCKAFCCFCGIITLCYFCCCFCCCCNCCCGKCKPEVDEEYPMPEDDEDGEGGDGDVITTQPTSSQSGQAPIALPPS